MIEKVIVLPAAARDGNLIHKLYEAQRPGLGKEFTETVFRQIEELQKDMILHRTFINNIRYIQLKRFPYTIFYRLDEEPKQLVVVAILGNKQDQLIILKSRD